MFRTILTETLSQHLDIELVCLKDENTTAGVRGLLMGWPYQDGWATSTTRIHTRGHAPDHEPALRPGIHKPANRRCTV